MSEENFKSLRKTIRDVPDFPKKGIIFKDITTLLNDAEKFNEALSVLCERYKDKQISQIVAVEARGFIFGSALAALLKTGFIPVRKKGKLPAATYEATYNLEYGTDTLAIHQDAIKPGEKVLIVDDLLATGGTISAVIDLVNKLQGKIVEIAFLIELEFLKGRQRLDGQRVFSMIKY